MNMKINTRFDLWLEEIDKLIGFPFINFEQSFGVKGLQAFIIYATTYFLLAQHPLLRPHRREWVSV